MRELAFTFYSPTALGDADGAAMYCMYVMR
jgi:hypothetical protein